jgi:hypothetical protein
MALVVSVALGMWVSSSSAATVTMGACANGGVPLSSDWTTAGGLGGGITPSDNCTAGGRMDVTNTGAVAPGGFGHWETTTPAGMQLLSFSVPANAALINPATSNDDGGSGLSARYVWDSGNQLVSDSGTNCCGGLHYASAAGGAVNGRHFSVEAYCTFSGQSCGLPTAAGGSADIVDVKDLTLTAEDDVAPALSTAPALASGTDLWQAGPWVRGPFNLWFTASNSTGSGVCAIAAYLDGTTLSGGSSQAPNSTMWQQCIGSRPYETGLDTGQYANDEHTLEFDSIDAASPSNHGASSHQVGFDNTPPTIALAGPGDVASAGSTQNVTATATAGPSGVHGITCSVDGAAARFYASATAQIPVSGLGAHQVSCFGQNNAVDSSGQVAVSGTQTFNISLRNPTSSSSTFAKIVDKEICKRVSKRVHHKVRKVRQCKPRTIKKREIVTKVVKRHGKKVRVKKVRVVRVPVLPHALAKPKLRVGFGHSVTLSGVLGSQGGALAGQPLSILAAPENGLGQYAAIATVTTGSDGSWSVKIPAGPSRLLEAAYAGNADNEPATSAPVKLTVPARVRIRSVTPLHVAWGGTIHIHGRLYGGYLPAGGALVRLRYGAGGSQITYGVKTHVGGDGAFTTSFTFGPGNPSHHVKVAFQVASLPTGDYPFAPARSNTVTVIVGGHPHSGGGRSGHRKRHHRTKHHHKRRSRPKHHRKR